MTACLEFSVGKSYCDPFSLFGCFNGVSPAIDQLSPRDSSLVSNWKGSVIAETQFITKERPEGFERKTFKIETWSAIFQQEEYL
jgi:hypothetical protein